MTAPHHVASLHGTARLGLFYRSDDDVADVAHLSGASANDTDAKQFFGSGVVRHAEPALLLNHLRTLANADVLRLDLRHVAFASKI
ncbi:MAG: hypothetical protein KatS3mg060_2666 [Dehalococcoidia bacterium]|nr:MAG: hypothetical protein KatS3mg060_2666 [Dehalococcoidia bacterium]